MEYEVTIVDTTTHQTEIDNILKLQQELDKYPDYKEVKVKKKCLNTGGKNSK